MSTQALTIYLDDPSGFTAGVSLSSLVKDDPVHLADFHMAEQLASQLRENAFSQWMATLADALNSSLPDYEVRLVHLDTADYLEFIKEDVPQE